MSIDITNLSYAWKEGDKPLLLIEQLSIAPAAKVLLQGPSGCGKTTLLSLLAGVLLPQQGQIRVLKQAVNQLNGPQRDRFRADHIGFIFQMFNLIPYLSVLDNVLLALRFSPEKNAKLKQAGLFPAHEATRLLTALGLEDQSLYHRPVTTLSMGQQQRVAAARALIGKPEIIIADEPTSALDSQAHAAFLKLLFEECQKAAATLIYVSHDEHLNAAFDQTISMADFCR